MRCPNCGHTLFSDDFVSCRNCNREFLMGELLTDEEEDHADNSSGA